MLNIDGIEKIKILLVDDDDSYVEITSLYLQNKGLNVIGCTNPIEALEICKKEKIDIILLDYFMPQMTGEEFLVELKKFNSRTVVILQTGYSDKKPPIETLTNLQIQGYYDKAQSVDQLLITLLSTIKTINLLLYRANPDTNKIDYNFMSISPDDENCDIDENAFDLDTSSENLSVANEDNYEIERSGFTTISLVNVFDKDEYEKIKKEKYDNQNNQ